MKTVRIALTQGYSAVVDGTDIDLVSRFSWRVLRMKFVTKELMYAHTSIRCERGQRSVYLHRLIMNPPSNSVVDHINGDGLDNRRANLRLATNSQNVINARRLYGNIKYRGVMYRRDHQRFISRITIDGKRIHIGAFKTAEEAARAYDIAALQFHGSFAVLNFGAPCNGSAA